MVVVVLGRNKTTNKTTRFLLQMLAQADIMFYVFLPLCAIIELLYNKLRVGEYNGFYLYSLLCIACLLLFAAETFTAWMAVTVTYQRYVAVSRPLHAHVYVTTSRARAAVAIIWISAIILEMPFDLPEFMGLEIESLSLAIRVVSTIIVLLLPMSFTVILNIRLIVCMRNSSAFIRHRLPPGNNDDSLHASSRHRVTVTLIAIVIVYLVCQLPMTTVQILEAIFEASLDPSSCFLLRVYSYAEIAYDTSVCFIVFNSLADCVTYCITGKRFRQILIRELLCRRAKGKK
jgi:hypothetical protein